MENNYELFDDQKLVKLEMAKAIAAGNKKILTVAPTGFGKTILSLEIIGTLLAKGNKVLFTVPRIKLATQTREKFGFGNLILGTKTNDEGSNFSISSVQSLYSRKIKDHFDYIFIDECHYGSDSNYQKYIFNTYGDAIIIGLSATPLDSNGYVLHGYDKIINEVSVKDLIKLGRLCDVDVYTSLEPPKTADIPIVDGDYNQTEASKVLRENQVLTNTLSEWEKVASLLKTLVFATDIEHADVLQEKFHDLGYESACVHSKMKSTQVDKAYNDFNEDRIQILINVDMATFGFDEPSIECLLFARPIKSLRLYKQMVGRGIRTFKGKDKCLIVDCANVILDNGYPTDDMPMVPKPVFSPNIDRLVSVERIDSGEVKTELTKERVDYLQRISSLFDLYSQKEYANEAAFQDDVKTFLNRCEIFFWRQNSGKILKEGSWLHFTDKPGLPDISVIYKGVYIGLELKMKNGIFTKHQKVTLPELANNGVLFFIIDSFDELFITLEQIKKNIIKRNGTIRIKPFTLSDTQLKYREKLKIESIEDFSTTFKSNSTDNEYTVKIVDDKWVCECEGYKFRKTCKHITQAKKEFKTKL